MSRWVLPVPESPIRHRDAPLRIQSPVARVWIVAGLMFGFESKSKAPSHLGPWKVRGFYAADGEAPVTVIALRQQQFCQESLVGELFLSGDGEGFVQDRADGGQAQPAAGLVHGGDGGLFGQAAPTAQDRGDGGGRCGGTHEMFSFGGHVLAGTANHADLEPGK